jgi:hypothetical protein
MRELFAHRPQDWASEFERLFARKMIHSIRARRGRPPGSYTDQPSYQALVTVYRVLREELDRHPGATLLAERLGVGKNTVERAIRRYKSEGKPWPPGLVGPI